MSSHAPQPGSLALIPRNKVVSKPTFCNPPLQVMEDCLYQSVGDLVHKLQRIVKKFLIKMEVHELQRKVEECQRKMEIKSEIWREQHQTMLAPHSVQKPHAQHHHHHNIKTQPLYSQIRHPIKPSSPSRRSIHPSLRSRKRRMHHFKCQPPCRLSAYCQAMECTTPNFHTLKSCF